MMNFKRYIALWGVALAALLAASCAGRKSLSDKELAQVFHDAFLANAYTSSQGIKLDSLKLYEPIFQKYGYTTEDVQYTIGSFATRKSARLSDVVERAISMLEQTGSQLDFEVSMLDTIDNIAVRRTSSVIYRDSLLEFHSLRDSSKMRVTIEDIKPGQYIIEFDYLIDTLDTSKKSYYTKSWLERDIWSDEEQSDSVNISKKVAHSLRRKNITHHKHEVTVAEPTDRLEIIVATIEPTKSRHHATIKRFTVSYKPTKEQATEMMYRKLLNINIFDDKLLFPPPKDSL